MKIYIPMVLLVIFAFIVSRCVGNSGIDSTPTSLAASTEPPATEPLALEDTASLIAAFQAEGATTETGDSIVQDFFSVEGQTVKVNGADIQVFEYENAEDMEKDASQVAPDGGSIGTSMVTWIDTPHFYRAGRIIVLYIGSDQAILDLLNKVLGSQFAGQ